MTHSLRALALGVGSAFLATSLFAAAPALARSHIDPTQHYYRHGKKSQPSKKHRLKAGKAKAGKAAPDARQLFAAKKLPANLPPESIGRYDLGCLAGASPLPADGPHWQVMRPSRNRAWGRTELVDYLKAFSDRAYNAGWNGLLVGDMSMPRGGPMPNGHASHQIGLDVDIWLHQAPDRKLTDEERESMTPESVLKLDSADLDMSVFTQKHADMVKAAAQDASVARIFITPAIKKYLCDRKDPQGADSEWLRRLRPWYGHDDHIHVRLHCPKGDNACREQPDPPPGDGCGQELTDWMTITQKDPPNSSTPQTPSPKNPVPLSSLPNACKAVLNAKP